MTQSVLRPASQPVSQSVSQDQSVSQSVHKNPMDPVDIVLSGIPLTLQCYDIMKTSSLFLMCFVCIWEHTFEQVRVYHVPLKCFN